MVKRHNSWGYKRHRQARKLPGIYMIKHESGKNYIGQSVNIFSRWNDHIHALVNNDHHNRDMQIFFNGNSDLTKWSFHILELLDKTQVSAKNMRNVLRRMERKWFDKLDPYFNKTGRG
jgi:hypothetical protein